jgi:hypothetical protein
VNSGSGSRASELFDEILKLFKILMSKLARHIQKPVEIVILQNLSGVFDFASLQDQEIVGKKIKYITNFGFSNFHYLFQIPCFLTPCSIF